jgi:hypothetical protein
VRRHGLLHQFIVGLLLLGQLLLLIGRTVWVCTSKQLIPFSGFPRA